MREQPTPPQSTRQILDVYSPHLERLHRRLLLLEIILALIVGWIKIP